MGDWGPAVTKDDLEKLRKELKHEFELELQELRDHFAGWRDAIVQRFDRMEGDGR